MIIGGGDHDQWWKHRGDVNPPEVEAIIIGGGDHDDWRKHRLPPTSEVIIGGGDHDDWRKHRNPPSVESVIIGGGDHDDWRKHRNQYGQPPEVENVLGIAKDFDTRHGSGRINNLERALKVIDALYHETERELSDLLEKRGDIRVESYIDDDSLLNEEGYYDY